MSTAHASVRIPLSERWFDGLSQDEKTSIKESADAASEDPKIIGAIAAMLDMHQRTYGESILSATANGHPLYDGLRFSIEEQEGNLCLALSGVPDNSLALALDPVTNQLTRAVPPHVSQIMLPSLVRDVLLDPAYSGKASQREAWLRSKIRRTGALDVERMVKANGKEYPIHRISIQGGHCISNAEYQAVAEWAMLLTMADPGTGFVTGCGDGVMRAPFSGADQARTQLGMNGGGAKNIGLTELGILSKEAPNKRVGMHFTASDIEARMEVFLRLSQEGVAFPGGVGTFEEIMTNLGVLMHPKNSGIDYPFYLLERRQGSGESYMDRAKDFLNTCFGDKIDDFYKVRSVKGDFESVVKEMVSERIRRGYYSSPKPLWNETLFIPDEIGEPFHPTPDRISKLNLSSVTTTEDAFRLMVDLRRFFSAVVHWTVKDQPGFRGWNGDRPALKGDLKVLQGAHDMVSSFMRAGRIPLVINKEDAMDPRNFPYEIPGA